MTLLPVERGFRGELKIERKENGQRMSRLSPSRALREIRGECILRWQQGYN